MKHLLQKLLLLIFLTGSTGLLSSTISAQGSINSCQIFYDELSPYGNWMNSPQYGYVWVPNVAPGFTPYGTNGYWAYTEDGWTWISNYAWGWAPFHYGRWYFDDFYGAIWVPGYEWVPGWVIWRQCNGYYGWAPIGPGISYHDAYGSGYHVHHHHWRFMHEKDFGRNGQEHHYVNRANNQNLLNKSVIINKTQTNAVRHTTYYSGPDRNRVETVTGKPVPVMRIEESTQPGERVNNNQLVIYRPEVSQTDGADHHTAPKQVKEMRDVKKNTTSPVQTRKPVVNPGTLTDRNNSTHDNNQTNQPREMPAQPTQNNTSQPARQDNRNTPAQTSPEHNQHSTTQQQATPAPQPRGPRNQPQRSSPQPQSNPQKNRGQRRIN